MLSTLGIIWNSPTAALLLCVASAFPGAPHRHVCCSWEEQMPWKELSVWVRGKQQCSCPLSAKSGEHLEGEVSASRVRGSQVRWTRLSCTVKWCSVWPSSEYLNLVCLWNWVFKSVFVPSLSVFKFFKENWVFELHVERLISINVK